MTTNPDSLFYVFLISSDRVPDVRVRELQSVADVELQSKASNLRTHPMVTSNVA